MRRVKGYSIKKDLMSLKTSYIKYFLALLLFGSNGIVASHISLTSYEIVLLRTLIGSLFLIVVFISSKQNITFHKYKRDAFCLLDRKSVV